MDKPWKVIFAFVGVFIGGAVFGGLFALRIGKAIADRRAEPRLGPGPLVKAGLPFQQQRPVQPASPPVQAANLLRRFTRQLDLTPEQSARILPLIDRATGDFRRQQQVHFREDTITLQHLQEDIRKELTPDQRAKLDQMEERQRKIIEERLREEQAQRAEQGLPPLVQRPKANNPGFNPNNPNQRGPNQPQRPGQQGQPQRPFKGAGQPAQYQPGGPNEPTVPPPEPRPPGPAPARSEPKQ